MTSGVRPNRFDRPLRITAGVLGVIVAIPPMLAFFFVVMFVWLGSEETPIWLAVPVGVVAIVLLYLAIKTLNAGSATTVTVGLLGVLEIGIGVFLLIASPELLPATIAAIAAIFVAGAVALAAAWRIHARGPGVPELAKASPVRTRADQQSLPSPAKAVPMRNGARARPVTQPSAASAKPGTAAKSGAKKSGRKK